MTKYILHGGNVGDENNDNHAFFREMTLTNKKSVNFLICCFACDENKAEDKFIRHSKKFQDSSSGKRIIFKLADIDVFTEQVKWADVMFFEGGSATGKLVNLLKNTKDLGKMFEGKTVGGSSAGANFLSKYYYGNEAHKIEKGLGILDIKSICHYEGHEISLLRKLANYKQRLPIVALPNYKWVVLYQ